jgi:hypothetical protein
MDRIKNIINEEIDKLIVDNYVPSTDYRKIMPIEVTDEELEQAEQILDQKTDKSWDSRQWGFYVIGVTGKYQVYYTFWKYTPPRMGSMGQVIYMGNLSQNIVDAARKAKQISGIAPVFFDDYETLSSLKGAPADVIGFGKYRGKTLGEVYATDPQYVIWIANKYEGGKGEKGREFRRIAKELADGYFRELGDTNRAAETKDYFGNPGDKFAGPVKVLKTDQYFSDYSGDATFRIRAENDDSRFQFYVSPKALCKLFGIEYKTRRDSDTYGRPIYSTSNETLMEIKAGLENIKNQEVNIKGTVKGHREIVGKKWTTLSRVAFTE